MDNDLTKKVVDATSKYLGSNAERFVLRQINSHLNINPADLTPDKLDELAKWIEISAALLIDKDKAKSLSVEVASLK